MLVVRTKEAYLRIVGNVWGSYLEALKEIFDCTRNENENEKNGQDT